MSTETKTGVIGVSGYAHSPNEDVFNPKLETMRAHGSNGLHGSVETWEKTKLADPFTYTYGYGNELFSEAVAGALPLLGNTPQRCNFGLYAEQLSGTSFTTPRVHNKKVWMYKIRPSAAHAPMVPYTKNHLFVNDFSGENGQINPNQLRFKPFPLPPKDVSVDFVDGIITLGGAGDPSTKAGFAVHVYCCNADMKNKAFCNSDGDLLVVPQLTPLTVTTETGKMRVAPGEFFLIPRGIKFSVDLDMATDLSRHEGEDSYARGYICEVYDSHFIIPDLGPIGANGLAHPKHFASPTAFYESKTFPTEEGEDYVLVQKFIGKLFSTTLESSPFDVVAWSGNYIPVKYDLANFNTIGSVSYDHLDPSIFTVLTSQTTSPGVAAIDFVVFPPRYAVQEDTFRPPYYHRNIMTEFMGNVMGQYDAKPEGFVPGSASLHSCMMGHGPDAATYKKFSDKSVAPNGPVRMSKNDLAFMFESTYIMKLTKWANEPCHQQTEYYKCWMDLQNEFRP